MISLHRKPAGLAFGVALLCSVSIAQAQVLIGNCQIIVQAQGTITTNPGLNVLSSKNGGGARARATVRPNSLLCLVAQLLNCYSISAPPPIMFVSSPSGANTGTTFASSFYLNGGAERLGSVPVLVANGTYNVEVDLTASKAVGIFPSGNYRGEVTVRCE